MNSAITVVLSLRAAGTATGIDDQSISEPFAYTSTQQAHELKIHEVKNGRNSCNGMARQRLAVKLLTRQSNSQLVQDRLACLAMPTYRPIPGSGFEGPREMNSWPFMQAGLLISLHDQITHHNPSSRNNETRLVRHAGPIHRFTPSARPNSSWP